MGAWKSVVVVALVVAAAGCARSGGRDEGADPPRPRVSAPATLNPDGAVPWVDERATEDDFSPQRTPVPKATGPTCRAADLSADAPPWIHKSTNQEAYNPLLDASLYGYVNLTNHGPAGCTLAGIPAVTLSAQERDLLVPTDQLGTATPVGLPPGGSASFRLDWSAPYCHPERPDAMRVELPGGAGVLDLRLTDATVPGCVHQEIHPEAVESSLSVSSLQSGAYVPSTSAGSNPYAGLTAVITGTPATVRAGDRVTFAVTVRNPTAAPVSLLSGRPGFTIGVFCLGTNGETGVNQTIAYLLNNRAVTAIPAGDAVTFDMVASVPGDRPLPGPTLTITWRMLGVVPARGPYAIASLPTTR
jgi:hypothetical protein